MSDVTSLPRVTIALATYNGAAHLEAQLASYVAQTHANWDLWVSDDGSHDATRTILENFAAQHGMGRDIRILDGPRAGVATNFLTLLCHPGLPKQPVALSDQDDVWLPEKLALGLAEMGTDEPVIYGAQSIHTDDTLTPIGKSLGGGVTPSFGNAVTQNIVSGHSCMLNPAALAVVRRAGVPAGIPYHDWWLYQLITGVGGHVALSSDAVLLYRQHGRNAMGSHQGLRALATRTAQVFGGTYREWIMANTTALAHLESTLTPEAQEILAALKATPPRAGFARIAVFRRYGVRRTGRVGNLLLNLALLLGRV
ncbi:MAG: glycosyltransferase [Sulfitobacter sp.]